MITDTKKELRTKLLAIFTAKKEPLLMEEIVAEAAKLKLSPWVVRKEVYALQRGHSITSKRVRMDGRGPVKKYELAAPSQHKNPPKVAVHVPGGTHARMAVRALANSDHPLRAKKHITETTPRMSARDFNVALPGLCKAAKMDPDEVRGMTVQMLAERILER